MLMEGFDKTDMKFQENTLKKSMTEKQTHNIFFYFSSWSTVKKDYKYGDRMLLNKLSLKRQKS